MRLTIKLATAVSAISQKQLTLGVTVFGEEYSKGIDVVWDYRLSFSDRLFISVIGMVGN